MGGCDSDSDDSGLAFANVDLSGVDFDRAEGGLATLDRQILQIELDTIAPQRTKRTFEQEMVSAEAVPSLCRNARLLAEGKYFEILEGEFASQVFDEEASDDTSFWNDMRHRLNKHCTSLQDCVEAEMIGIAAFNLFQQLNYTGPTFDVRNITTVNPHKCFKAKLRAREYDEETLSITEKRHTHYSNTVLAELACDGQWPCPVAEAPYLLLLARCIFGTLADPTYIGWMGASSSDPVSLDDNFIRVISSLLAAPLWHARAIVAHERLLLTQDSTVTLWKEVENTLPRCIESMEEQNRQLRAMVLLEFGLACHHFNRPKQAKGLFLKAKDTSGLYLEVTGADGKRTKFQHKSTAQLMVRASSAKGHNVGTEDAERAVESKDHEIIRSQMIKFSEDDILYERIRFENEADNDIDMLSILDQSILLGMCLDIKDNNPGDRLTAEEMLAYLARVLYHHDDWIVYSTALLERAWLEFEGNHTKERAILQMQALADQHTDILTITQSTRKSIEDSSPVQDRLKNLHSIVYPPRWQMLRDVAERYAELGVVTSAAEIFAEIESWDEVVECYRRAGKEKRAEEIVRERLEFNPTPRMWTALGDITNDPRCYEKAIEISRGRFSQAYISLGKHHFEAHRLEESLKNYRQALKLRPLIPSVWFRVGTISMQLHDWDGALTAFTEVVQQQPDEAEAWANVAAIHMHNKKPAEALPALNESLKHSRNNWRIWVSKLYTCLDLNKYDEATHVCSVLLDLRSSKSSQEVPELEEKCVRAVVGGTIEKYVKSKKVNDAIALDAARRSLVRVQELLDRLEATSNQPWVYETKAYMYGRVGLDAEVYNNLMKEYRALTSIRSWEKDDKQVQRVCRTVTQIVSYQQSNKEALVKSKFLLAGVLKKISQSREYGGSLPEEVYGIEKLLAELTAKIENGGQ